MIIIADSSSTRTEWTLLDGDVIVAHALTQGLNPFYLSRREISHIIRLGLPDVFSSVGGSRYIFMVPVVLTRNVIKS